MEDHGGGEEDAEEGGGGEGRGVVVHDEVDGGV